MERIKRKAIELEHSWVQCVQLVRKKKRERECNYRRNMSQCWFSHANQARRSDRKQEKLMNWKPKRSLYELFNLHIVFQTGNDCLQTHFAWDRTYTLKIPGRISYATSPESLPHPVNFLSVPAEVKYMPLSALVWYSVCICSASVSHRGMWYRACFYMCLLQCLHCTDVAHIGRNRSRSRRLQKSICLCEFLFLFTKTMSWLFSPQTKKLNCGQTAPEVLGTRSVGETPEYFFKESINQGRTPTPHPPPPLLIWVFGHFWLFASWYRKSREASSVKTA